MVGVARRHRRPAARPRPPPSLSIFVPSRRFSSRRLKKSQGSRSSEATLTVSEAGARHARQHDAERTEMKPRASGRRAPKRSSRRCFAPRSFSSCSLSRCGARNIGLCYKRSVMNSGQSLQSEIIVPFVHTCRLQHAAVSPFRCPQAASTCDRAFAVCSVHTGASAVSMTGLKRRVQSGPSF